MLLFFQPFFTGFSQILYEVVSWLFPEFKFQWLVDESKKHLPLELDFEHEGRNAEKIMHFCKKFPFVKVVTISHMVLSFPCTEFLSLET